MAMAPMGMAQPSELPPAPTMALPVTQQGGPVRIRAE